MVDQTTDVEAKKAWIAVRLAARAVGEVSEDYGPLPAEDAKRIAMNEIRARLEQFGVSVSNQAALVDKVLELASVSIKGREA